MSKTGKKIDANTKVIREAVRAAGAVWVDTTGDGSIGFDCILAFRKQVWLVEIKDGAKPASARKLTEREQKRAEELAGVGVTVHVVTDETAALKLIGAIR